MNYLIVGASSGLGREIAYTFAKNGMDLILVSRDERDLLALKSDIELKYKVNIKTLICNFSQINEVEEKIILWTKMLHGKLLKIFFFILKKY